mmetsp:Transcript_17537/g.43729  ORF Transcript_17537/g.43729 Transcript_17537/m.43729 type:complete len:335 (-) Transcript_17537:2907-3911(-)
MRGRAAAFPKAAVAVRAPLQNALGKRSVEREIRESLRRERLRPTGGAGILLSGDREREEPVEQGQRGIVGRILTTAAQWTAWRGAAAAASARPGSRAPAHAEKNQGGGPEPPRPLARFARAQKRTRQGAHGPPSPAPERGRARLAPAQERPHAVPAGAWERVPQRRPFGVREGVLAAARGKGPAPGFQAAEALRRSAQKAARFAWPEGRRRCARPRAQIGGEGGAKIGAQAGARRGDFGLPNHEEVPGAVSAHARQGVLRVVAGHREEKPAECGRHARDLRVPVEPARPRPHNFVRAPGVRYERLEPAKKRPNSVPSLPRLRRPGEGHRARGKP